MGLSPSKWFPSSARRKDGKNNFVELKIPHIRDAHNVIGLQPDDYTPLTLAPYKSATHVCCCPCCYAAIPEGFVAVVTKWGAEVPGAEEDGSWAPGFHCFWPWYSVSRLVTKQQIVFDTPVKDCKTMDDITINIDVLIVLKIVDATTFIYGLGPEKLDDLLRAAQEEVLRTMAKTIPVENIFDLHGANMDEWTARLNKTFEVYGVEIISFTVRNVQIPPDMAKDFEDKTLYESKTLEKQVQQESDQLTLNNDEEQQKLREECDNTRMAAEEEAVTEKAQITKEVREVIATSRKDISLRGAQRDAVIADITTTCDLDIATLSGEIMQLRQATDAQMEMETGKLEAEAEAYERQKRSQASSEAASKVSMGKKALAEAEGAAAAAFAARRAQEQELARLKILETLAHNSNIKIVTSLENTSGLAPDNSLVAQVVQQGMEAFRMRMAEMTSSSAGKLDMGTMMSGGLVRPMAPKQHEM